MGNSVVWQVTLTILGGAGYTIGLFFVCALLSIPLGLVLSFVRVSRFKVLQKITGFYVWVLRGTPLMLQLIYIYYGLPQTPVIGKYCVMGRFEAACVAFVLNYAAYFCEIFRGGIISVDKGQYDAAHALGLNRWQTVTSIIIPQMVKVVLPSVTNECVTLVKDTSLMTTIGLLEITHYAKALVNTTGGQTYPYLIAAIIYLALNDVLMRFFTRLEKKYNF